MISPIFFFHPSLLYEEVKESKILLFALSSLEDSKGQGWTNAHFVLKENEAEVLVGNE